jgi:hypothetical protein
MKERQKLHVFLVQLVESGAVDRADSVRSRKHVAMNRGKASCKVTKHAHPELLGKTTMARFLVVMCAVDFDLR